MTGFYRLVKDWTHQRQIAQDASAEQINPTQDEAVQDLESAGEGPRDWPSDVAQIHANSPSLTPIQPDLFWRGPLSGLPQLKLKDQLVR